MLTAAHRGALTQVEQWHTELEGLAAELLVQRKRLSRLRSAKLSEEVSETIRIAEARESYLLGQVAAGTQALFQDALGIAMGSVVSLVEVGGAVSGTVCVDELRARQLSSGSAVLTVAGRATALAGMESPVAVPMGLLIAAESRGQSFRLEA